MAKKVNRPTNTGKVETRSFDKGLNEDITDYHLPPNMWTQARNATNNTGVGDIGDLSNEASNLLCSKAPYQIIGTIHIEADRFLVYSTDNTNSEIGQFFENTCKYKSLVNDPCLGFKDTNLIKGVAKENFDCTWQVYWADSLNPDRTMNIDEIPWIEICVDENNEPIPNPNPDYIPVGCLTCTATEDLDCDAIRLAPLVKNPCFTVDSDTGGGELNNGSYYVVGSYLVNGQRVTDYSMPSNIATIFHHNNASGSIKVTIDEIDESFDEFELILVQVRNLNAGFWRIGSYSTRQKIVFIDTINPAIGLDLDYQDTFVIRNSVPEKSDALYENGPYLLRVGPKDKFDFNYQPLANQIKSEWIAVEYPETYYRGTGQNVGYLRDEVYSFFIRWVYNTGDVSSSYHIPGRPFIDSQDGGTVAGDDYLPEVDGGIPYKWKIRNTASEDPLLTPPFDTTSDGGRIISSGKMAYWESSEKYDDDKADVWNASQNVWSEITPGSQPYNFTNISDYDLCGKPIRHHKFPENFTGVRTNHYNNALFNVPTAGNSIRVMGVRFSNVKPPVDNQGVAIRGIVGYEILRGSREGNKSIYAKGMLNNMRKYNPKGTTKSGLYPNYPYNDLGVDPYFTNANPAGPDTSPPPLPSTYYSKKKFTFVSPETSFKEPYLAAKVLKVYSEMAGSVKGKFIEPSNHPKHKLLTNFTFILASVTGIGYGIIAQQGKRSYKKVGPSSLNTGFAMQTLLPLLGVSGTAGTFFGRAPAAAASGGTAFSLTNSVTQGAINAFNTAIGTSYSLIGGLFNALTGGTGQFGALGYYGTAYDTAKTGLTTGLAGTRGLIGGHDEDGGEVGPSGDTPFWLRAVQAVPTFSHYWSRGFNDTIKLIKALGKFQQYALQHQSHCKYVEGTPHRDNQRRRLLDNQVYLNTGVTNFGDNHLVNNLFRGKTVALSIEEDLQDPIDPLSGDSDNSRYLYSDVNSELDEEFDERWDTGKKIKAISYYSAIKEVNVNQYGQLNSIVQVPASTCMTNINLTQSPVIFGGDIYVGRYTEKNTMFFFSRWLSGQPDGAEFDYRLYNMLPFTRFYANTTNYDQNDLVTGLSDFFSTLGGSGPGAGFTPESFLPSGKYHLDNDTADLKLIQKNAWMYLFNSGVRDFFVETEVNIEKRDWGDLQEQRHYDYQRYTDLALLFDESIIKAGNYRLYDYSLSVTSLFTNYNRWGFLQGRNYDPLKAENCFVYKPNRVIYSLPQFQANVKDFWKVFLPLNYQDFKSRVSAIKPLNKNGAFILFDNQAPIQFLGVDQLKLDSGNKLTIGDGGLFNGQALQNIVSTDESYEYGSCQNRLSIVNTAYGVFWISQNQGKIFQYAGKLSEISSANMKWWLSSYLPYKLTEDFPEFDLKDNPVSGIACQTIFDNENQILYFCKKDYKLRTDIADRISYISGVNFLVNDRTPITLGDPAYFEDASWTLSYDPKVGQFISYHDWHPDLLMASKGNFLTIKEDGIWKHNDRCDSYCNFYGEDYPFEVEYAVTTPQMVNTLRSIEYYMEAYKYADNCYDRFHVLDYNFDEAIIYNSEQCSGLLDLNLSPKNNAPEITTYPKINPSSISILFSKEEQKYRFNQFWDITADRGEFNPAAERMIFNTAANGYVRELNAANLDYNKIATQRKKFRHYKNTVLLRRTVSGDRNMIVQLTNDKNLYSPR
jgi:hypothetical protein